MSAKTLKTNDGLYEVRFVERAVETGGHRLVTEWAVEEFACPPPHLHPRMQESWEVLEGALIFTLDGVERRVAAGDSAVAAPGVVHAFRKDGAGVVRWRQKNEPALDHELLFVLEHGRALRHGAAGRPGPIEVMRMLDVSDARFVGMPRVLQRLLSAIGHPLNRRLRAELKAR